jgi:hypothetical protein
MPYIDFAERPRVNELLEKFIEQLGPLSSLSSEVMGTKLLAVAVDFTSHQHTCVSIPFYCVTNGIGHKLKTPGELNYFITRALMRYCLNVCNFQVSYKLISLFTGIVQSIKAEFLAKNSTLASPERVQTIGVIENVSQEFYARVARRYENIKIAENTDIPEYAIIG